MLLNKKEKVMSMFEELNVNKICIYGLGLEGLSTLKFLTDNKFKGKIYLVDDQKDVSSFCSGNVFKANKKIFETVDLIIKSPGIIPEEGFNFYHKLTSQTKIFMKHYKKQTIGITATKGKSTTSSLIYHVLKESKKDVILAGNIGLPIFDNIKNIKKETMIVYELSCHQLSDLDNSPHISLFLNCYEEHLDRYKTFDNYLKAKENIYIHQNKDDILFIGNELNIVNKKPRAFVLDKDILVNDHKITFGNNFIDLENVDYQLLGRHNFIDIAFCYSVAKYLKIDDGEFINALKSFKPLKHRLEKVGEYKGITFYNDSISTSSQSTIAAIETFKNLNTILLGGLDRGIDYGPLVGHLRKDKVDNIIFMYDSGLRMKDELGQTNKNVYYCKDLKEATLKAFEVTKKNSVCLLSPASASYGYFKNFEERGEVFKQYIKEIGS